MDDFFFAFVKALFCIMPFLSTDITSVRFAIATNFLLYEVAPFFPMWEGGEFLGFLLRSPFSKVLRFFRRKATITLFVLALDEQVWTGTRVS